MASQQLRSGQVKALSLLGRELVLFRSQTGKVTAMDAFCPHMGAHLGEGRVEGESLRCLFHYWKFDRQGHCVEIPCMENPLPLQVKTWPVADHYGLIWVWVGGSEPGPLPRVPELATSEVDVALGTPFSKRCHPNVLMINAIDEQHFNSVHNLPVEIKFQREDVDQYTIQFHNTTRGEDNFWLVKLLRPLYQDVITYSLCYWYGSTGSVTVGPDQLHFYIIFAIRPTESGGSEGQTLLLTQRRRWPWGWMTNRILLWLTQQVGNYFAQGDTKIFQTIRYHFQTPIQADRSILQFIHHVEQQQGVVWQSWQLVSDATGDN
jgi:phenylpropionate dioxygenase-like ring-hydroxylating dioxygenase large terminal subunit